MREFLKRSPGYIVPLIVLLGTKELLKLTNTKRFSSLLIKYNIIDLYMHDRLIEVLRIPRSKFPKEVHEIYDQLEDYFSNDKNILKGKDLH